MHLNKTDIYVLSWLWNATSSFPAFLGQSGCMWHCWKSGDQREQALLLKRGLVGGEAQREVKFPLFLLPLPYSPCSVAGCCSLDVFCSEYVRSCCTNLSHCHHISISVIT